MHCSSGLNSGVQQGLNRLELETERAARSTVEVLELNPHVMNALPPGNAFDRLMSIDGIVHREVKNRRTVEFELGAKRYFIKGQRGCGWGEILKNLLSLRLPVVSARTEWSAIEKAHAAGISTLTVAGKGLRGINPAALESFVITEALDGMISLEQLANQWRALPPAQRIRLKRALIPRIAEVARKLHSAGMNHRDFYICHFLARDRRWSDWRPGDDLELTLIDLHRAQQRRAVPERWLVKDLGGLLFSAMDAGLTRRDLLRFLAAYRQRPWREVLATERNLWRKVASNANDLYQRIHGKRPPLSI